MANKSISHKTNLVFLACHFDLHVVRAHLLAHDWQALYHIVSKVTGNALGLAYYPLPVAALTHLSFYTWIGRYTPGHILSGWMDSSQHMFLARVVCWPWLLLRGTKLAEHHKVHLQSKHSRVDTANHQQPG